MIAVYYAAVIAWAARYTIFSFDKAWGDDPEGFLFGDYLQAGDPGVGLDFVPGVLVPLVLVWVVVLGGDGPRRAEGHRRHRGGLHPGPVRRLPRAGRRRAVPATAPATGLDALFTPDWGALGETGVWVAAFGQIFFSLSVGFGIMITYASYVGRRTDMTGSGLVVGFANSGFELLAGIGVFAALGFMANAAGVAVDEVATEGLGLAFVAFPAIISEAPAGALIGVLFFGSLVLAGLTSLVSVIEVVISAVRDKFEMTRVGASMAVGVPAARDQHRPARHHDRASTSSTSSTTSSTASASCWSPWPACWLLTWVFRKTGLLREHLNRDGSVHARPLVAVC